MTYKKSKCATRTKVALAMTLIMMTTVLMTMAGCGGSTTSSTNANGGNSIAEGNWSITGASTVIANSQYSIGGHITQSGSTLSGNVGMIGPCDPPQVLQGVSTVPLTGSVSGNLFSFTFGPTASGSMIQASLAGSGTSLEKLNGSFTVSGGCASEDQVTATATLSPPLSGTWAGAGSATTGEPDVEVSVTLTQSATANDAGTYFFDGTLNYSSSTCTANGIELDGYIFGANQYFTFDEANADPVWFSFIGSLDDPASVATFTGSYQTIHGFTTVPGCEGDSGTIQFSQQ
jgi:hypothetical protein